MTPFGLAGEDVRQMYLDERHPHGKQRVADGETRVGEGGRVDDRPVGPAAEPLDRFDQLTLVIGLRPAAFDAERARPVAGRRFDLAQRGAPVHVRLTLPQQIQVRAVQDGDVH